MAARDAAGCSMDERICTNFTAANDMTADGVKFLVVVQQCIKPSCSAIVQKKLIGETGDKNLESLA